ncbi:MAG: hypothetical protein NVS3B12_34310 [Acidimicrobiales bacterium]
MGSRGGRELLIEGTIPLRGRTKVQINRQALRRTRDLLGALRVSVFSPDDLVLVKGGPGERRRYLDDLLVACHPKWDALRADVERILRQRATLLKQAGGRLSTEIALTLDVWDAKLASAGTALAEGRAELTTRLGPAVATAYRNLAGRSQSDVGLAYRAPWLSEGLASALGAARIDDVRRGASTVGPHRDDLVIALNGLASRTHASQGEQRCLALALRLGGHGIVASEAADEPVLVLDDVFSELDPERSAALLAHLPPGQALLTTAGPLPVGVDPAAVVEVCNGQATTRTVGPF